jgi:RimJ/RimL family protein N-acetyltransferase
VIEMSVEASDDDKENRVDAGDDTRELPHQITIPSIHGEMVELRPATLEDFAKMDEIEAFAETSSITGRDPETQRALELLFVSDSIAWNGGSPNIQAVFDVSARTRTIAWSMFSTSVEKGEEMPFIGMMFLAEIDGWSRSARIQVILGEKYRGRGYSRDAMPRVMTYGFASPPVGLGLERIWVAVPEKNHRTREVYQSLGFVPEGVFREALWDADEQKYQDRYVFGLLSDEYDPIRALDTYGMKMNIDNPGAKEAFAAHEHSIEIKQRQLKEKEHGSQKDAGSKAAAVPAAASGSTEQIFDVRALPDLHEKEDGDSSHGHEKPDPPDSSDSQLGWPYVQGAESGKAERASKRAWWRNIGRSRSRKSEKAAADEARLNGEQG